MNNLLSLLRFWKKSDNHENWVLGTVFKTEGSAYRKAGSHMLISESGKYYGLLSGGCLESDIVLNARKVMRTEKSKTLVYDSLDEDDLIAKLVSKNGVKLARRTVAKYREMLNIPSSSERKRRAKLDAMTAS